MLPIHRHAAKCPNCGSSIKVNQWKDTLKPNATWIECTCGLITKTFYDKDPEKAKTKVLKMWNKRAAKRVYIHRRKKNRIKSCVLCSSKDIISSKYDYFDFEKAVAGKIPTKVGHWLECRGCGLITEPIIYINDKEKIMTLADAVKLWNGE